MAETIYELQAKITADASELNKALKQSETSVKDLGKTATKETKSISQSFSVMGKSLMAVGASIVGSLGLVAKSFENTGSELHDLNLKTGVSVKALAGLKYAAEQNGASLGTIEMAIKRTASAITDAQDGLETVTRSFNKMGVSIADLQGLSVESQFIKIANSIAQIKDPMTRASVAVDLFGRSGTDMLPMLAEGAEGLQKLIDKGIDFSGMTAEMADKADEFGDSLTDLKAALGGIVNAIGEQLAPILKDYADAITNILKKTKDFAKTNPEVTKGLTETGISLGEALIGVGGFTWGLDKLMSLLSKVGIGLKTFAGYIGLAFTGIEMINFGIKNLNANSDLANSRLEMETERVKALNGETNTYTTSLKKYIDVLRDYTKNSAWGLSKAQEQANLAVADSLEVQYNELSKVNTATVDITTKQVDQVTVIKGLNLEQAKLVESYSTLNTSLRGTSEEYKKLKQAALDALLAQQKSINQEKESNNTLFGSVAGGYNMQLESVDAQIAQGIQNGWSKEKMDSLFAEQKKLQDVLSSLTPGNIMDFVRPNFDKGGVVGGSLGQPQLAVVHGGEEVLTPSQRGGSTINNFIQGSLVTEKQLSMQNYKNLLNKKRKDYTTGV